ncbi:MAG: LacI family DNA-binding transcriptional regulator [Anaerolineales bacterium]
MRTPTIRDVAEAAGVGVATVSRVLNNSQQVSEATRQKVLSAIDALGFRPNSAARTLVGGRAYTLGVLSPLFTIPSFVERLNGIQAVLDASEYDLVLYSVRHPEHMQRRLHDIVTGRRVDGLLVLTMPFDEAAIHASAPDFPIVAVAEQPIQHYPHVCIDNFEGGRLATEYIIQNDHALIGFLGDFLDDQLGVFVSQQRFEGFKAAMNAAGLPYLDEWCLFGPRTQVGAAQLVKTMLREPDRPTAIVAASDTLAFGAMQAARELHLRVPQDLAIIGFDDIPAAATMGLTTVHQPLYLSGQLAAERLLEWVALGAVAPELHQMQLPLEIVRRETV